MIPVSKPKITKQDINKVLKSLKDGWVSSDGPDVIKFEKNFANFIGKKYCISVSSGTAALEIAVRSLNLKKNDEVIIPNFTIISNALAVIRQEAKPVFVDCNMDDWNMDLEDIKKKISKRTKVIIVTHIYSFSNRMEKIISLCKKNNIKIIEDAAEVIGLKYKNKYCGTYGELGTFSFYANKHITTGEGGMICTDSYKHYLKCKSLRNLCFGKKNRFNHDDIGWNYRMTNIQAALGLSQLKNINNVVKKKMSVGRQYFQKLKKNKNLQILPPSNLFAKNIYWIVGIVIKNKKIKTKNIMKKLLRYGIQTRPFFWPMSEQKIFKKLKIFDKANYPNSKYLSERSKFVKELHFHL